MMKYFGLLFVLFIQSLAAGPVRHDFHAQIYYLETPDVPSYPLLIMIDGSYSHPMGPRSVLGLHAAIAKPLLNAGIGVLTLERKGVDGKQIDPIIYHLYNTPSQRLADHLELVRHLQTSPPIGWNGQLIVMGGSEGGPIAIKLAYAIKPTACITLAGCGDQSLKDYIWSALQVIQAPEFPSNREQFEELCIAMKADPDPHKWWFGQTYLYWADALEQTEYQEFLALECPALVIMGSEDLEWQSTDRLMAIAHQMDRDVTYLLIEGMDHYCLNPRWKVLEHILHFLERIIDPSL